MNTPIPQKCNLNQPHRPGQTMKTKCRWLAVLILQMSISAGAQDAVTPAQIAAAASDGGNTCSPVVLSCHAGGTPHPGAAPASTEQQERERMRLSLQQREL